MERGCLVSSRLRSSGHVVGMVLLLTPMILAACGTSRGARGICAPSERRHLLSTVLTHLIPSPIFSLPSGEIAWVSTGNRPDQDQLFSGIGGIGTVSVFSADRSPRPSTDVTVSLRRTDQWVRLPVGAGEWRSYTTNLGVHLGITVVSCPSN